MAVPAVIVTPDRLQMTVRKKEECLVQITNISFEKVLFRMLTTTPERYLVKPTKGVIDPSASASILITLSPNTARGNETSDLTTSDDFRLEYCFAGPDDFIEPRCANVPALIKGKKQQDRHTVHSKTVRCTVDLTAVNGKWSEVRLKDNGDGPGKNSITAILSDRRREDMVKASLADKSESKGSGLMRMALFAVVLYALWWYFW
uniref:Uncharacterized protein TCIL3000_11_13590 n=1 Tax=Trypanosoma congolense (strain IL3000) TaxID=1068625 RepID=G0V2I1_TRYCI|nr:unnamed protein product [Trypanosoma congolense IL3000]